MTQIIEPLPAFRNLTEREIMAALKTDDPLNPIAQEVARLIGGYSRNFAAHVARVGSIPKDILHVRPSSVNLMARFITRVELHHADDDDYKTLHAAMEREGFSRTIVSSEGVKYHLPTAEYDRQGNNLTLNNVLESAKKAAATTGCKFGTIVTESNGSTWSGLAKA